MDWFSPTLNAVAVFWVLTSAMTAPRLYQIVVGTCEALLSTEFSHIRHRLHAVRLYKLD